MATWDFIQKFIMTGDASTGKSSLLVRLTDDRFLQHSEPTIGVEFGARLVVLTEGKDAGKKVKLQIWDTAGQESFRSITRSYYRGAGGALLVFDLTERSSFVNCRSWLADLRAWGEEDLVVLLVGNKGDLCEPEEEGDDDEEDEETTSAEGQAGAEGEGGVPPKATRTSSSAPAPGKGLKRRAVSRKEALRWVEEEGLSGYIETSAKMGTGVEEAFNNLTRTVHQRHQDSLAARKGGGSGGGSSFPLTLSAATRSGCC
ncbi:hypothetical protein T439DRAFT_326131 [Meredithblackwellia eburnea MCA 4105]